MISKLRQAFPIASVLAGLIILALVVDRREGPPRLILKPDVASKVPEIEVRATAEPSPTPVEAPIEAEVEIASDPEPVEPTPPTRDRVAVAKGEEELEAARRDRDRAAARLNEAKKSQSVAAARAALEAAGARKLAFKVRDPSAQVARASAKGGFIKAERDKLSEEVATLRSLPLPKATSILSKNPVARPAKAEEYHFELRHERVSFIDLERLLELAKSDAQVKLRMAERTGVLSSQVGPVGWFSLSYALGRAQSGIEELLERHSIRFDLRGWEVVPTMESRGETYEATRNPISGYSRAINRISPGHSVVTMWVYPDSFGLFRQLRDELNERGFSVAARPLPEGMSIRGSPLGSVSASQ